MRITITVTTPDNGDDNRIAAVNMISGAANAIDRGNTEGHHEWADGLARCEFFVTDETEW